MPRLLVDMTEPELAELMRAAAKGVEKTFADLGVEKPRFGIVVFNDPKCGQYISNCERGSMIEGLRECADRLARNQDVTRN